MCSSMARHLAHSLPNGPGKVRNPCMPGLFLHPALPAANGALVSRLDTSLASPDADCPRECRAALCVLWASAKQHTWLRGAKLCPPPPQGEERNHPWIITSKKAAGDKAHRLALADTRGAVT